MTIFEYKTITSEDHDTITDARAKIEALNKELTGIQTDRAAVEQAFRNQERAISTEKQRLEGVVIALVGVTIT